MIINLIIYRYSFSQYSSTFTIQKTFILFPKKTGIGRCVLISIYIKVIAASLMDDSPSKVSEEQLKELHIKVR